MKRQESCAAYVVFPLLLILLLYLSVHNAYADNCTPPNPPRGFGASWSHQYKQWCENCCGTFGSDGQSCEQGANWGCGREHNSSGSGANPIYDRAAENTAARAESDSRRQLEKEQEKRRKETEKKIRQEEFQRQKKETLDSLKGVSRQELKLNETNGGKPVSDGTGKTSFKFGTADAETENCPGKLDFETYQERETERRRILADLDKNLITDKTAKPRVDWCKLHIPLPPSPAAAGYCEKEKGYETRRMRWKQSCAPLAQPLTASNSRRAEKLRTVSDCLGVYDGAAKGCGGEIFAMSDCVNRAVGIYLRCLSETDTQPNTLPKIKAE